VGSVVIGSDGSNDKDPATHPYSTSDSVETLAQDVVEIIIHSTTLLSSHGVVNVIFLLPVYTFARVMQWTWGPWLSM
jgi:hypothetical protein